MTNAPRSIGVIMDGNRRWAEEQGLSSLEGHKKGLNKMHEFISWIEETSVREVTFYAFSTENWKRSPEEVAYLMELFTEFRNWAKELEEQSIKVRFIGQRDLAPQRVQEAMNETEERTKAGIKGTIAIAFSYGGRAEILDAVNTLLAEGREQVTEEELRASMWSTGLSDPDLIIRTSGEKRLSNFLTWQSVYSELFFTDTYWPAFSKEEFFSILTDYETRERRHGK